MSITARSVTLRFQYNRLDRAANREDADTEPADPGHSAGDIWVIEKDNKVFVHLAIEIPGDEPVKEYIDNNLENYREVADRRFCEDHPGVQLTD